MPVTPPPYTKRHRPVTARVPRLSQPPLGAWELAGPRRQGRPGGGPPMAGPLLLPLPRASGAGLDTPATPNRGLYPRARAALPAPAH